MAEPRVGLGFDVHPPANEPRPLSLGGVRFEGEGGLEGHSDGDAVCHAVADALLGAAGLGDIGQHFPEDDPAILGLPGLELLGRACSMVRASRLAPSSVDLTVIAERPAISPRRDEIRRNLAEVLGVPIERVSVKATRPEGLGLAGSGVGCIAMAVLLAP
jgi:2-C-methyl-D-erythritol 2,4-cyclodiphosphate synthase